MAVLVGMDEAGYGPNLGPLVVAATAWSVGAGGGEFASANGNGRIPGKMPELCDVDLYDRLASIVARLRDDERIAIADSKVLYRPGTGLRQLERGVHATLAAMGRPVRSWSELVESCGADPEAHSRRLSWHKEFDCPLPVDAAADDVAGSGQRLARECADVGVRPLAIRARLVFPAEFNELVEYHGTKGAALSHLAVGLLRDVLATVRGEAAGRIPFAAANSPDALRYASRLSEAAFVVCDKHGGRNRYAALLQHFFPDEWIETLTEGRAESRYRWGPEGAGVEVTFRVGGEAFLPTALASMTAKYLREVAMRAFNQYWCDRVPGLRPTAGYPADAKRFRVDIQSAQRTLGISDHVLWRCR